MSEPAPAVSHAAPRRSTLSGLRFARADLPKCGRLSTSRVGSRFLPDTLRIPPSAQGNFPAWQPLGGGFLREPIYGVS